MPRPEHCNPTLTMVKRAARVLILRCPGPIPAILPRYNLLQKYIQCWGCITDPNRSLHRFQTSLQQKINGIKFVQSQNLWYLQTPYEDHIHPKTSLLFQLHHLLPVFHHRAGLLPPVHRYLNQYSGLWWLCRGECSSLRDSICVCDFVPHYHPCFHPKETKRNLYNNPRSENGERLRWWS